MLRDDVKAALKAWGHATVNRFALTRDDRSKHVLASTLRDLPSRHKPAEERELVGRDGRSRRLYMAGKINCGFRKVPVWAVDPVRARNDADRPHDNPEVAVDLGIPDDLRWVESAVIAIERNNPLRGLVLRTEYTVSASQKVKARMVAETYGGRFTKDMYRRELEKAIDVIAWEQSRAA